MVETLSYETAQFLQGMVGHDLAGLRVIADRCGVGVTSRDAWVRLEGDPDQVATAGRILKQLEVLHRQGGQGSGSLVRVIAESVLRDPAAGGSPVTASEALRLKPSARRGSITVRSLGQMALVEAMRAKPVVFAIGAAGTGKTFLAMAEGLELLREKKVQRLVLTRPAVEAGEALGFLPGDLNEKIYPYLRPLYDALHEMLEVEEAERLLERGIIEVAPLAYMRGRTLKNAFVILDEAQNTTCEQMLMFLTRLGEGSRCVVTGDPSQIDLKRHQRSGLLEAVEALEEVDGVQFVHLQPGDIVRHPVVQSIVEAYARHRRREA
jgi:phosphate starvation-inducible PhoH-like protein